MGFSRAGELYDPLIHGETVGDRVGSTDFLPGTWHSAQHDQSYVRYLLPQTITNGEFSMDVEGLRANAPGDKSKVFGMQEGQDDYITNRYRVDIQYRGTNGSPPNAITFRVIYGDADDLDVRYEPDTAKRFRFSVSAESVNHVPLEVRRGAASSASVVLEGGVAGTPLYNHGVASPDGVYAPTRSTPTWVPRWVGAATSPPRLPARSTATSGCRTGPGQPRSAARCGESARHGTAVLF